jgi:hypothetical protein
MWEVWDEEGDYYGKTSVYAVDAEEAGQKYAEERDSERELSEESAYEVKIRKFGDTKWKIYKLHAELSIDYYAREIK